METMQLAMVILLVSTTYIIYEYLTLRSKLTYSYCICKVEKFGLEIVNTYPRDNYGYVLQKCKEMNENCGQTIFKVYRLLEV